MGISVVTYCRADRQREPCNCSAEFEVIEAGEVKARAAAAQYQDGVEAA